jgi:predicted RNA-binding Zn ribbon-like protein
MGSRTHQWEWLGDHLAIDFANTMRRLGPDHRDLLVDGRDVAAWAEAEAGRVPAVDAADAHLRLDEVRELRDDVLWVLFAAVRGRPLPPSSAERINARARALPAVAQLGRQAGAGESVVGGGGADPLDELLARVAAAAIELVGGPGSARLGYCDSSSCGQFFTRSRSDQRWCGTACGTRVRVARHSRARRVTAT